MIKKILSQTVPTLMLALLLINPGFVASPGDTTNPVSSQQRAHYQDNQLPAGLNAGDWSQIRALIAGQSIGDVVSSPSEYITVQRAYLKASNTEQEDQFTYSLAVSGDTVVVGAPYEGSNATGVNGDQNNNDAPYSGAVYVFVRSGTTWSQQAYLKASNTDEGDEFGYSVAVSGDTILVGSVGEASNAKGVNQNQSNNDADESGAAYVFVRSGTTWNQQAYLKASNTDAYDNFGSSVAVSGDTVVVGATHEDSNANQVNGNQNDNSAMDAGAAYVFVRNDNTWNQQAYLKAANSNMLDSFGWSVAASGNTVAVGVPLQDSASGAAYVFVRNMTTWSQQAFLKASNSEYMDLFGGGMAISDDTLVVGAPEENSKATGVNGDDTDNSAENSGAAYVFFRSGSTWSQQAYLKASNTNADDGFGTSVAVSGDTVLVGAPYESSSATGVNGNQNDNLTEYAGAAYVFTRSGTTWSQQAYLKASITDAKDYFGDPVAVSGETVVIGAAYEDSHATGVNGDQNDNSAESAGAAYIFSPWRAYLPLVFK